MSDPKVDASKRPKSKETVAAVTAKPPVAAPSTSAGAPEGEAKQAPKVVVTKAKKIISLAAVKAGIRITPKKQVLAEKAKRSNDAKDAATNHDVRSFVAVMFCFAVVRHSEPLFRVWVWVWALALSA